MTRSDAGVALRFTGVAVVAAILYAMLGRAVSQAPPGALDRSGSALAGEAPRIALVFTESCWWYVLLALACVMIAVAFVRPDWRARCIYALLMTPVAWQVSDALKTVFRRPRPGYWILIHEPTFSYSSGHAMFAVVVYALWAYFFWNSTLPRAVRFVLAPLTGLWACGIIWSRLALGAHYVTDLIGGVLLGITALASASAIRAVITMKRFV